MLRAPFPVGSRIHAAAARSVSRIVPYVGDVVGVAQQLGAKLWRIGGGRQVGVVQRILIPNTLGKNLRLDFEG